METNLIFPARPQVLGEFDPWLTFIQVGPAAMQMSRLMMKMAVHHSDFRVGSVVLAESHDTEEFGLFGGANQNLLPGQNDTKVCAEEVALTQALTKGFKKVHAIFVAGEAQPDTQSGITSETLLSCGNDRSHLWDLWEQDVLTDEAPLVSVDPNRDVYEKYPHADFQAIHTLKLIEELQAYHDPGFRRWSAGERPYLTRVDYELSQGKDPHRALLAHLAVTGQLGIGS